MKKRRKVCLFIVEGPSDEAALYPPLKKFVEKDGLLRFFQVHGDITADIHNSPHNIMAEVGNVINSFLSLYKLEKKNLAEVVHLVDLDGCFIPDECVHALGSGEEGISVVYRENEICAQSIQNIQDRNHRKSQNLQVIISKRRILGNIPYSVYYFSCNLDHVTIGSMNLSANEKVDSADHFANVYKDDQAEFISFMDSVYPPVDHEYRISWNYPMEGIHSLKRHSNLLLFLEEKLREEDQE